MVRLLKDRIIVLKEGGVEWVYLMLENIAWVIFKNICYLFILRRLLVNFFCLCYIFFIIREKVSF